MTWWSTTSVTSQSCSFSRRRSDSSALLVGQVEREVVELRRPPVGHAGRLREALELDALVLEERDRLLGAELEEVVAEGSGADGGDEPGAEHPVVEAHGRVHVGRDEGEVVDAPPMGPFGADVEHGQTVVLATAFSSGRHRCADSLRNQPNVAAGRRGGLRVFDNPADVIDLERFVAEDYQRVVSAVGRITGTSGGSAAEEAVQHALVTLLRPWSGDRASGGLGCRPRVRRRTGQPSCRRHPRPGRATAGDVAADHGLRRGSRAGSRGRDVGADPPAASGRHPALLPRAPLDEIAESIGIPTPVAEAELERASASFRFALGMGGRRPGRGRDPSTSHPWTSHLGHVERRPAVGGRRE